MDKNLKTFMDFLGYGSPKSNIWFIGIEEGGKIIDFDSELEQRKYQYRFRDNAQEKTRVWDIIAQFMYKLYKLSEIQYDEYRNKMFSKDFQYFFLTNLFPLPKPNINTWPPKYIKYFKINDFNYDKFLSIVRSYRYKIIYETWKLNRPKLTICFSSTFYHEFIHLLNLGHSRYDCLLGNKVYFYPDENVLLTPFFDNKNIDDRVKNIIKEKLINFV